MMFTVKTVCQVTCPETMDGHVGKVHCFVCDCVTIVSMKKRVKGAFSMRVITSLTVVSITLNAFMYLTSIGCAGTFEEARIGRSSPSIQFKVSTNAEMGTESKRPQLHCDSLDNQATWWGFAAKSLAFAGGAAGLSSLPVKNEDIKDGLVIGAGVAAIGAVGAGYVWDIKSKQWTKECGQ